MLEGQREQTRQTESKSKDRGRQSKIEADREQAVQREREQAREAEADREQARKVI